MRHASLLCAGAYVADRISKSNKSIKFAPGIAVTNSEVDRIMLITPLPILLPSSTPGAYSLICLPGISLNLDKKQVMRPPGKSPDLSESKLYISQTHKHPILTYTPY